jgi:hypothetical protein
MILEIWCTPPLEFLKEERNNEFLKQNKVSKKPVLLLGALQHAIFPKPEAWYGEAIGFGEADNMTVGGLFSTCWSGKQRWRVGWLISWRCSKAIYGTLSHPCFSMIDCLITSPKSKPTVKSYHGYNLQQRALHYYALYGYTVRFKFYYLLLENDAVVLTLEQTYRKGYNISDTK